MKVYDTNGIEHDMEAVDAREAVEHCGYSLTPPAPETAAETDADKPARAKK